MNTRMRNVALLAGVTALAIGGAVLVKSPDRRHHGVLDAIPASSYLVVTLDVAALRASPLGPEPLRGGKTDVPSLDQLSDACGFPALSRLKSLALAIPEEGDPGAFGIVAEVEATPKELATCAEKAEPSRGHKTRLSTRGPFTILEQEDGGASAPKVVYREGGPLLLGQEPWITEMMETLEGKHPSLLQRPEHARLRAAVTPSVQAGVPTKPTTLVASAILPKALRDRLRGEIAGDADRKNAFMAGVLGVSEVGLAISVGPAGQTTDVVAHMVCEDGASCAAVEALVERKRLEASQDFAARLMGLGPVIDSLKVASKLDADGVHGALDASAQAPSDALAKLVDRFMRLRRFATPGPAVIPPTLPTATDEPLQPSHPSTPLTAPSSGANGGTNGSASGAPRKDP